MRIRRFNPRVTISSSCRGVRAPRKGIAEVVAFVARREGVALADVDVAVVGLKDMVSLHRRFLGRTRGTDVLSFDLSEADTRGISAQIVVCGDTARREAPLHGLGLQGELMLYVIHGLLHLTGYEDATVRGASRMRARQEELLREFRSRP
jgi:probable rRNA maturation factor